jgi:hypothetical protein
MQPQNPSGRIDRLTHFDFIGLARHMCRTALNRFSFVKLVGRVRESSPKTGSMRFASCSPLTELLASYKGPIC